MSTVWRDMAMDRRDALKALATVVGATGMTVTPVTTLVVQGVEVVLIKSTDRLSHDQIANIMQMWKQAVHGTALEHTRAVVLDHGLDVEFVRTR